MDADREISARARLGPAKPMILAWAIMALTPGVTLAGAAAPLTVSQPWVRVVAGPTPAAAYFTLSNASGTPAVLVGASSPDCAALMMHQSRNVNGVESMTMVARRTVPPHGRIVFSPGGFHLMCMSPSKAVRPGGSLPITLRFGDGRRLTARFPVRPLGG